MPARPARTARLRSPAAAIEPAIVVIATAGFLSRVRKGLENE
jgi:hypothetical protein